MNGAGQYYEFVFLPAFERAAKDVLSDEEIRAIQQVLVNDPRTGAVLKDAGGVRKIRAGRAGQGKRGGARVIYYHVERKQRIYFLLVFAKNVQENLTAEQKKRVRRLVALLEKEN